jgi:coenzyme PQQ precursor peptide PqqA
MICMASFIHLEALLMIWETPSAIELRLGMEINSYVSVR